MDDKRLQEFYRGKKVLVTGHTGFKGSWLTHVLLLLGADVVGVALPVEPDKRMFTQTDLQSRVRHYECDVRDADEIQKIVSTEKPDIVFHLAAQALVRRSYEEPVFTITTNVVGTTNVLEAVRTTPTVTAMVVITTDKVYENQEWVYGYRENEKLGGYDPYSGSKAAADIVANAYRLSFFNPAKYGDAHTTLLGIARAGNVIGGGDWSEDRLVPDIMRSVLHGDGNVSIRNPHAVRPWEHVLEPLSGYLLMGMRLAKGDTEVSGAWNFGPQHTSWVTVGDFATKALAQLGKGSVQIAQDSAVAQTKHESTELVLDTTKAYRRLGWASRWSFEKTLKETVRWYAVTAEDPESVSRITQEQILDYFNFSE